jgi:arylsulfatase A-like enzyme
LSRRRRPIAAALVVALLTLAAGACGRSAAPAPPRNVVVVMVDTLRADHLSLYGYSRPTSPELDRWAASSGVAFENARAQAPCTFPSVNSLLTSRSPGAFLGGEGGISFAIPATVPSLAVLLRQRGYATAAISASPIVRVTPSKENRRGGFGAGFETFDEFCYWREARCVTTRAREVLRSLREPYFLYVHYLDPHDPYQPPADAAPASRFAGAGPPGNDREFVRLGRPAPAAARIERGVPGPTLTAADLEHLVALYDDEIRYWDGEFAALREDLLRRGAATTVVAVVSDHGEEFLEHGRLKHCHTLFDTELHTPFVLFAPGVPPRRVAAPVSNLDLVPTLLELAGAGAAPRGLEGRSLSPLLRGESGRPPAPQFATFGALWSVVSDRHKLIQDLAGGGLRLYDLTADPRELVEMGSRDPATLLRLRRLVERWREVSAPGRASAGGREAEELLRSVGYLQ